MVSYYYDAWGELGEESYSDYIINLGNGRSYNAETISSFNRFFYRSYFFDSDIELYYLKNRFYDPSIRRFISPDNPRYIDVQRPYGTNLYAYCCNNPVMFEDSEGCMPNWLKWLIGGVAFAGALVLTYFSGGSLLPVFVGMGISIASGALLGGAVSYANGGSFVDGLINGAADGAMWGGISALAGSLIDFVRNFSLIRSRGVVIGKGMNRVDYFADQASLSKYSPMKGYNLIRGNGKSAWRVKLADNLSVAHNKAWINRVMRLKKPIYDIGLGKIGDAGAWYGMELTETANYINYIKFYM